MVIDFDTSAVMFLILVGFLIIIASIMIPVYGFHRKRWKGMAWGCLLQPVACAIVITVLFSCVIAYEIITLRLQYKSAMVTVRTTEKGAYGVDTLTWYLKADDDECLVEYKRLEKPDSVGSDSLDFDKYRERFDIIRLDTLSNAVCVDDRLVIRFDLQNQKVTATDYDQPTEVLNVNWDKVKTYFNK
jgi:hypothetical protein